MDGCSIGKLNETSFDQVSDTMEHKDYSSPIKIEDGRETLKVEDDSEQVSSNEKIGRVRFEEDSEQEMPKHKFKPDVRE